LSSRREAGGGKKKKPYKISKPTSGPFFLVQIRVQPFEQEDREGKRKKNKKRETCTRGKYPKRPRALSTGTSLGTISSKKKAEGGRRRKKKKRKKTCIRAKYPKRPRALFAGTNSGTIFRATQNAYF
jgi:hypothetical protein